PGVAAGSMRCDPAAGLPGSSGGPQMNLIVGSQHRFVRLANDPPVVEDGVWSANVTVQNLTLQPFGTLDGEDADLLGVRVFFVDEPSHGVGVLNHDGTETFLGGTPAEYDGYSGSDLGAGGILSQGEVSRARQWQFRLNGATEFRFSVLVSTEVPDPGAFGVHLTRVSAGDFHACGDGADGKVYCWGYNGYGQLGNGSSGHRVTPVLVAGTRGL